MDSKSRISNRNGRAQVWRGAATASYLVDGDVFDDVAVLRRYRRRFFNRIAARKLILVLKGIAILVLVLRDAAQRRRRHQNGYQLVVGGGGGKQNLGYKQNNPGIRSEWRQQLTKKRCISNVWIVRCDCYFRRDRRRLIWTTDGRISLQLGPC